MMSFFGGFPMALRARNEYRGTVRNQLRSAARHLQNLKARADKRAAQQPTAPPLFGQADYNQLASTLVLLGQLLRQRTFVL
jgi:hypothetical protein